MEHLAPLPLQSPQGRSAAHGQSLARAFLRAALWLTVAMAALSSLPLRAAPAEGGDEVEARYRLAATAFYQVRSDPQATAAEWRAVAETFQRVQQDAPKHGRAADALFSAGVALREALRLTHDPKDWQGAQQCFQRFVTRYPRHALAADSLMHQAELQQERREGAAAAALYRQVLAHFPGTEMAALADQRLKALPAPDASQPVLAGRAQRGAEGPASTRPSSATALRKPPWPVAEGEGSADPVLKLTPGKDADAMFAGNAVPAAVAADAPAPSTAESAAKIAAKSPAGPARLKRMQVLSALQFTRVILTTSRPVKYHVKPEAGGAGLRLELKELRQDPGFAVQQPLEGSVVQSVQVEPGPVGKGGQHPQLALVLKLHSLQKQEVKTFDLPNETKIVLDVYPKPKAAVAVARAGAASRVAPTAVASASQAAGPPGAQPPAAAPGERISLKESLGLKVRSVMLDAGHGGHDPGAMAFGLQEKDLTLGIARHLRDLIRQRHPQLRVGMTREGDEFVPLAKRPRIAKAFGADLFVSIHLNANPQERFRGVETYFLNLTSDASALRVAARENATSEKKVSDLNVILLDLLRDTNILESSKLAEALQSGLVVTLKSGQPVRDLGVKQAPFMVLIGSEMPSVLVEAGFVTNRAESRLLQDADYQERIAQGIYAGLGQYIAGEEHAGILSAQGGAPAAAQHPPQASRALLSENGR